MLDAKRIREILKKLDCRYAAKEIGIHENVIYKFKKNRNRPRVSTIHKIVNLLKAECFLKEDEYPASLEYIKSKLAFMTISKVAKGSRVSSTTLYSIMSGETDDPTYETIFKLETYLRKILDDQI